MATGDAENAAQYLSASGVSRRDEAWGLPENVRGFWVCDAASNIIPVHETDNQD